MANKNLAKATQELLNAQQTLEDTPPTKLRDKIKAMGDVCIKAQKERDEAICQRNDAIPAKSKGQMLKNLDKCYEHIKKLEKQLKTKVSSIRRKLQRKASPKPS